MTAVAYHLRMDAPPLAQCDSCNRQTWALDVIGMVCDMPQPDGRVCGGQLCGNAEALTQLARELTQAADPASPDAASSQPVKISLSTRISAQTLVQQARELLSAQEGAVALTVEVDGQPVARVQRDNLGLHVLYMSEVPRVPR